MSFKPEKTLFLIDGSSFLYRAYYGLRPMHTSKGLPVQAVYGFCKMIKKLVEKYQPQHMALVWDSKGKTTRHELFKDYKATRQAPPSDLFEQKELIVTFANSIGLHQFAKSGIEADDLMFSLAQEWNKQGGNTVIVTSDKDMGQALTQDIVMLDTFKDQVVDSIAFEQKMGFPVSKAPFYFSLLGDASDNIPGVKGVGKKGAQELVNQFESLQDLYDNLDKVEKTRTRTALATNKENAFLSEKLFLLQYQETGVKKEDLLFDAANWPRARVFFEELEFKSFLRGLGQAQTSFLSSIKTAHEKGYNFVTVTTQEQVDHIVAEIQKRKLFAYDTETDGLRPLQDNMVGMSFCFQEKESFYLPFAHDVNEPQLDRTETLKKIKTLFENKEITIVAHHAKFDQLVLSQYGIQVHTNVFDTLLAAVLVKADWQKATLKALSDHYFDEPMFTFAQMVTEKKLQHFGQVDLKNATEYAAADAHQTFKLYPLFKKMLKEQGMEKLYYDIELPTMKVLFAMEKKGIYCDQNVLYQLDQTVVQKLSEIKKTILDLLGPEFETINLNSPKQISHLLFEYLKLPPKKKNAKGSGYSTDNEVLVELSHEHPIPGYIAQYRELFKLKSTYIDALPEYINPKTKRIHTTYSQTRAATGRLASSDPNMQNIPVEGLGSTVRMAFKPEGDRVFLSADYSQIELRVLAHLSQDEALIKAFNAGHDIHAQTAAGLFEVPLQEVTKHQRGVGKRINFSILYGLTPFGLAKDLVIPQKDAKRYIDAYFEHYPKVRQWMDFVIEQAKKDEFVTTWQGRKRSVSNINERNRNLAELGKRIAVNTVAQGTAAEIMKKGMINVFKVLLEKKLDASILLQIHDEILLSVAQKNLEETKQIVKQTLESVVNWEIPLVVDIATGKNWKEAK